MMTMNDLRTASRVYISKLVEKDEGGSVFALLSCFEAIVPLFASLFFTSIFNATLDTLPGLAYQMAGLTLVIPLSVFAWVDIKRISELQESD